MGECGDAEWKFHKRPPLAVLKGHRSSLFVFCFLNVMLVTRTLNNNIAGLISDYRPARSVLTSSLMFRSLPSSLSGVNFPTLRICPTVTYLKHTLDGTERSSLTVWVRVHVSGIPCWTQQDFVVLHVRPMIVVAVTRLQAHQVWVTCSNPVSWEPHRILGTEKVSQKHLLTKHNLSSPFPSSLQTHFVNQTQTLSTSTFWWPRYDRKCTAVENRLEIWFLCTITDRKCLTGIQTKTTGIKTFSSYLKKKLSLKNLWLNRMFQTAFSCSPLWAWCINNV